MIRIWGILKYFTYTVMASTNFARMYCSICKLPAVSYIWKSVSSLQMIVFVIQCIVNFSPGERLLILWFADKLHLLDERFSRASPRKKFHLSTQDKAFRILACWNNHVTNIWKCWRMIVIQAVPKNVMFQVLIFR